MRIEILVERKTYDDDLSEFQMQYAVPKISWSRILIPIEEVFIVEEISDTTTGIEMYCGQKLKIKEGFDQFRDRLQELESVMVVYGTEEDTLEEEPEV